MKLAITSDNHFDVNKIDLTEIIPRQAEYLLQQQVRYYFITGDLFNNFEQSLDYVEQLQQSLADNCAVYFIAGNHDMISGITYAELEQANLNRHYLHHRHLTIPTKNFTVIGNNGWYDYSFSDSLARKKTDELNKWKQTYWVDQKIDSPLFDQERMTTVIQQVRMDLQQVPSHNHILFLTHFVPQRNFIFEQLDHPRWQIINAFMGSQQLGKLLEQYQVRYVAFGHLHTRQLPQTINNVTYLHRPLGYGLRRLFEWQQPDFLTEWQQTLTYLEI